MNPAPPSPPAAPDARERSTVSVLIVSFNTREMVRACIASTLAQGRTPLEVIVVDNASRDGTVGMVREAFPGVAVIANGDNRGFAAANNQALAIAKGRYALLLNPDTVVLPGALDECVRFADANEDAGVVSCRVLSPAGEQVPTLFRTMRLRDVAVDAFIPIGVQRRFKGFGYQRYVGIDLDRVQDVETVTGCFMLVRREVWEEVGVLDDDFFIYGEESEWCWRIRRGGWRVRYFPGARIVHDSGASTVQLRVAMTKSQTRSLLLLIQKTQGRAAAYVANALMLVRETPRAAACLAVRWFRIPCGQGMRVSLEHSAARFPLHLRGLLRTDWRSEARKPPHAR